MNPILSIIVPVYKVEAYIHKCITSILNQTLTDFELILIDDGSPDNCGTICDDYAKKDKRIIVIHQKNQGLSAARNAGLDIAKGEYITFVDSDDSIAIDTYYDNMEILLNDKSIDILEYQYYQGYNDKWKLIADPVSHIYGKKDIFLYWALHSQKGPNVWNKIYKNVIFIKVRFPYGKVYEDLYILPDISEKSSHLFISDKGAYFYLIREDSLSNGSNPFKREQPFNKQLDHYDAWIKVNNKIKFYKAYNKDRIFNYNHYVSAFICTKRDYPNKDLRIYEKEIERFNFSLLNILNSQLDYKSKLKLILIKIIGIRRLIFLYKYFKIKKANIQ
jgi:glycosyltransferase involved in cell wall biosynthesis